MSTEDNYERKYMPGVGAVLHRHKVTSPPWLVALTSLFPSIPLLLVGIALLVGGNVAGGAAAAVGGIVLGALLSFLMVAFASARVVVSEGQLHLQFGTTERKIPTEQIKQVTLAPSGSNKMGMGVRKQFDGTTLYTLWGDNQRAVHLELHDGSKVILACKEPDAMLAALQDALARSKTTGVRAAATSSSTEEVHEQHASATKQQTSKG